MPLTGSMKRSSAASRGRIGRHNVYVKEEWRAIEGFDGYEVSNLGRVRSWLFPGRSTARRRTFPVLRKPVPLKKRGGYLTIVFSNPRRTFRYVHHLVLLAFDRPKKVGEVARHLDGDSTNNAISNLRWGSSVENVADMRRHGTWQGGEKNVCAKLTLKQAQRIRLLLVRGVQGTILAKKYSVSNATICRIKKGKRYV